MASDNPSKDDLFRERNTVFRAINWPGSTPAAPKSQTGSEPASEISRMLRTLYSSARNVTSADGVKRLTTVISTKDAAKSLGVSQRTVQRWLKGQHKPSQATMKKLTKKARQAVTTKRGRAQMVRRARTNQRIPAGGVKVALSAHQGPSGYRRDRTVQQKLTPEEYEGFQMAWATGGDQAAKQYLEQVLSNKYVDGWQVGLIRDMNMNGMQAAEERSDPRALN